MDLEETQKRTRRSRATIHNTKTNTALIRILRDNPFSICLTSSRSPAAFLYGICTERIEVDNEWRATRSGDELGFSVLADCELIGSELVGWILTEPTFVWSRFAVVSTLTGATFSVGTVGEDGSETRVTEGKAVLGVFWETTVDFDSLFTLAGVTFRFLAP